MGVIPRRRFFAIHTFDFRYSSCCNDCGKEQEPIRMERFITDERTGLKYELVGDCCLIAGDRYAGYAGFFVRTMLLVF